MRSEVLFCFITACFFLSCEPHADSSSQKEDNSVTISEKREPFNISNEEQIDTSLSILISGNEVELEDIGAGVETAIDITQAVLGAGAEMLDNKRRKDSIKLSSRGKMFAYQLGLPFKDKKLILDAYENLSDKENIYAFKKGRREYLLVRYLDKSEEDLEKELEDYKALYGNEVKGEIKKIDLLRECGKRKKPFLTKSLRRKNDIELNCLTCGKYHE